MYFVKSIQVSKNITSYSPDRLKSNTNSYFYGDVNKFKADF